MHLCIAIIRKVWFPWSQEHSCLCGNCCLYVGPVQSSVLLPSVWWPGKTLQNWWRSSHPLLDICFKLPEEDPQDLPFAGLVHVPYCLPSPEWGAPGSAKDPSCACESLTETTERTCIASLPTLRGYVVALRCRASAASTSELLNSVSPGANCESSSWKMEENPQAHIVSNSRATVATKKSWRHQVLLGERPPPGRRPCVHLWTV